MFWHLKRSLFRAMIAVSNRLFGPELTHRSHIARSLNEARWRLLGCCSPAHRRQAKFHREHPQAPWFVPAAIEHIEPRLKPHFVGFEWGSGNSTVWFARRVKYIRSIEGRAAWYHAVQGRIIAEELSDKVDLKLVEVLGEHDFAESDEEHYAGAIDEVPDGSLDFAIVDGHFREKCLMRCLPKLKDGALLIVDNSDVIPDETMAAARRGEWKAFNNDIWETTVVHWDSAAGTT